MPNKYKIVHEEYLGNWFWSAYEGEKIIFFTVWNRIFKISEKTKDECEKALHRYIIELNNAKKNNVQNHYEEYFYKE